jgi:hypothetical protein
MSSVYSVTHVAGQDRATFSHKGRRKKGHYFRAITAATVNASQLTIKSVPPVGAA